MAHPACSAAPSANVSPLPKNVGAARSTVSLERRPRLGEPRERGEVRIGNREQPHIGDADVRGKELESGGRHPRAGTRRLENARRAPSDCSTSCVYTETHCIESCLQVGRLDGRFDELHIVPAGLTNPLARWCSISGDCSTPTTMPSGPTASRSVAKLFPVPHATSSTRCPRSRRSASMVCLRTGSMRRVRIVHIALRAAGNAPWPTACLSETSLAPYSAGSIAGNAKRHRLPTAGLLL